jgi:hypothetical protein
MTREKDKMAGFRESVHNNHNSSESIRRGEISDEINGQTKDAEAWGGEEFPCWSVPGRFSLGPFGAGVDIASDVLCQVGPPVPD